MLTQISTHKWAFILVGYLTTFCRCIFHVFFSDARFRMDKKCNPIKINENFIPEQHLK